MDTIYNVGDVVRVELPSTHVLDNRLQGLPKNFTATIHTVDSEDETFPYRVQTADGSLVWVSDNEILESYEDATEKFMGQIPHLPEYYVGLFTAVFNLFPDVVPDEIAQQLGSRSGGSTYALGYNAIAGRSCAMGQCMIKI